MTTHRSAEDLQLDQIIALFDRTQSSRSQETAWQTFRSGMDMFLIALKRAPGRADEAGAALGRLSRRIYNEDFLGNRPGHDQAQTVTHADVKSFLYGNTERLVQIVPDGQAGYQIMEKIVTLLTMTSSEGEHAEYNNWGDSILARITNGRQ